LAARDVTTTGPWFYEDDAALPADVEAFLEAGPPPVYVGFGSMVSADTDRVTRAVLEGASRGGRRVLLSKGWAGIGGGALPEGAMAVSGPMAHGRLFGRVAAVVHHGGAGTMAAALRAGAPQVLVPHILDQYYYAHRLATLGLAPRGIPVARLTADRLAAAIEACLAMPSRPRHEASARLRSAGGLQCAAAAIVRRIAAA
jgi:UDP:flavonoid glycosyltransferase YjiC (YdhE family)